MKKSIMVFLGLGAACAACCLPLIIPIAASIGLSGLAAANIAGFSVEFILCALLPLTAIVGLGLIALWRMRRRKRADCNCESACTPGQC